MEKAFSRVIIKDIENNILVVQDRPHIWNFPGGKKEPGESSEECAKREIKEEIGLTIHKLTDIYKGDFYFNDTIWKGFIFFAPYVSGTPQINEANKIKNIRFINYYNMVNFPPEFLNIARYIFNDPVLNQKKTIWI